MTGTLRNLNPEGPQGSGVGRYMSVALHRVSPKNGWAGGWGRREAVEREVRVSLVGPSPTKREVESSEVPSSAPVCMFGRIFPPSRKWEWDFHCQGTLEGTRNTRVRGSQVGRVESSHGVHSTTP